MHGFRNALGELAEQAKVYDVTGRAVRVARRRRRAARAAPVAAAVAVVVVGLVAVVGLRPGPSGGLDVAVPASVGWLPDRLEPPAAPPDPLPGTGVLGRGVLLYGSSERGAEQPVLLTEDGRQHRLAERVTSKDGTSYTHPSLSPDGRWLGEQRAGRYVVRDLTGTTRFELGNGHAPVAWSPDSRWLLLVDNLDESAPPVRLDLASGREQVVPLGDREQWRPVAVLAGGDVLLDQIWRDNTRNRSFGGRIVDPVSGLDKSRIQVDLGPFLGPDEGRTWDPPRLSPDGRTVWLAVVPVKAPEQGVPGLDSGGDLLLVDLTSEGVRRVDLPYTAGTGTSGRGSTPIPASGTRWVEPIAYLPEGLLLRTRATADQGDALQILDLADGKIGTVTELPTGNRVDQVLPRGA